MKQPSIGLHCHSPNTIQHTQQHSELCETNREQLYSQFISAIRAINKRYETHALKSGQATSNDYTRGSSLSKHLVKVLVDRSAANTGGSGILLDGRLAPATEWRKVRELQRHCARLFVSGDRDWCNQSMHMHGDWSIPKGCYRSERTDAATGSALIERCALVLHVSYRYTWYVCLSMRNIPTIVGWTCRSIRT
jgi:hypothetical protein